MYLLTLAVAFIFAVLSAKGSECPYIIYRRNWNATKPKEVTLFGSKPDIVLIKETGRSVDNCTTQVKAMQDRDMKQYGHDDIDCSFVISAKGTNVCEGRGWFDTVVGNKALVFCVMYDSQQKYTYWTLTATIKNILDCPYVKEFLDPNYKIITLRDTNPSSLNPGYYLYEWVKGLPRYLKENTTDIYDNLVKKEEETWTLG